MKKLNDKQIKGAITELSYNQGPASVVYDKKPHLKVDLISYGHQYFGVDCEKCLV